MGRDYALKGSTAYIRYEFFREFVKTTIRGPIKKTHLFAKHYNCFGKHYRSHDVYLRGDQTLPLGVNVDVRTLQLTQWGCCPPQLLKDFIMQEGGEMAERDPVLEAMKLHKRGYFGGGG